MNANDSDRVSPQIRPDSSEEPGSGSVGTDMPRAVERPGPVGTAATPREVRRSDVIGAIRLAAVASADCRTFRKVVDSLCSYAPDTPEWDTGPVALLLDAVRETKGQWELTDAGSKIERVKS